MGSGLAENWVPQIAGPQRPGEPERWVRWIQSARARLLKRAGVAWEAARDAVCEVEALGRQRGVG